MTVTTTSLAAGVTRTLGDQSSKLSAALSSRASATASSASRTPSPETNSYSVAVTDSTKIQAQALALRVDSLNVTFVGTQTDVIDTGIVQVSRILDQLQSLATRANMGGLSDSALELLNGQFQALRLSINNVPPQPPGSEMDAGELLESLGVSAPEINAKLGGFSDTKLLGPKEQTDLLSSENASRALATVASAQTKIDAQRETLAVLKETVEFTNASVEGAIQNQEASRATLTDADFDVSEKATLAESLLANPQAAIAAQTNRLPANVLQLLS